MSLCFRFRMSNNMAKIADARKTVEQLKLEVNIERMMVSEDRPTPSSNLKPRLTLKKNKTCFFSPRCQRLQQI